MQATSKRPVEADGGVGREGRDEEQRHEDRQADPEGPADLHRAKAPCEEHAQREGEEHAHEAAGEVHPVERPAQADRTILLGVGQGEIGESGARQKGECGERAVRKAADQQGVEDVADILEEE